MVKQISNTRYWKNIQFCLVIYCMVVGAYPQFASLLADEQQWSPIWAYARTNLTLLKHLWNLLLHFDKFRHTQPELLLPGKWSCVINQLNGTVKCPQDRFTWFNKHIGIFITKHHILSFNVFHICTGFTSSFIAGAHKCQQILSGLVIQQHAFHQLTWTQLHAYNWLYRGVLQGTVYKQVAGFKHPQLYNQDMH